MVATGEDEVAVGGAEVESSPWAVLLTVPAPLAGVNVPPPIVDRAPFCMVAESCGEGPP